MRSIAHVDRGPRVKTIGARLSLLFVTSVACMLIGSLLLGRYFVERQLIGSVEANLGARFSQIKDRVGHLDSGDAQVLLSLTEVSSTFAIEIDDMWTDPAYQLARTSGTPPPDPGPLRFFDSQDAASVKVRVAEGVYQSLRIRISTSLEPVEEAMQVYSRLSGIIAVVVLSVTILVGRFLSHAALRPIRLIEQTATRISLENLGERIPVQPVRDEVSNLARLLNKTFDRLETSFQQVSQFAEDASHELKTPLSLIRLNIERALISGELPDESRVEMQESLEEIDRLTRLIERLLFLSRAQAGEVEMDRKAQDPRAFVQAFGNDASALADARQITYQEMANEGGIVSIDSGRIRQVLLNLLSNALDATPAGGRIELRSQFIEDAWRVSLRDSGRGLPQESCSKIFERFVRIGAVPGATSESGGAGLGLAICRSIIELHGGSIDARPNHPDAGLTVTFRIPTRLAQSEAD